MSDLTRQDFRIGLHTQLDHQLAYINPRFENKILSHVIGNYMKNTPYPLYLAIHGKKGEGKTFQTIRVCSKYQIMPYYISGAQLCGSYEKDSISDIEENINYALYRFQNENEISVFIIDDFHLSIASTEVGVGRTVNSQILTGYLMNLADKAKSSKFRVPIILLGNDFDNLYEPLTREGRMDFFEWKPSLQEKISIVSAHFQDVINYHDNDKLKKLIEKYANNSVSFFTEIKSDIYKDMVSDYLMSNRFQNANTMITAINNLNLCNSIKIDFIENLIIKRIQQTNLTSHEERAGLHV